MKWRQEFGFVFVQVPIFHNSMQAQACELCSVIELMPKDLAWLSCNMKWQDK